MDIHEYWPHRLVTPFWVCIRDAGSLDIPECLYCYATEYEQDIRRAIQEFHTKKHPSSDLMTYFSLRGQRKMAKVIRSKVHAARMDVCSIGDTLYAAVDLELSEDLTKEELIAFTEQLEDQFKHGWGAEFELVDIPVAGGKEIAAWLDHSGLDICPVGVIQSMEKTYAERNSQQMEQTMQ